jgi:thiol-disulfide isomerase/thioredoxin
MTSKLALLMLLVMGCRTSEPIESDKPQPKAEKAPAVAIGFGAKARGVELVNAPSGDVADLIRAGRAEAKAHGRKMLVYIGATWCEPCQRFHQAAERGELDDKFPTLSLLVFDLDADRSRLSAALFGPGYVPYFGVPDEQGHGTSNALAGSIKGEGAVDNIAPRLAELVQKAP